ncbi:MAG: DegT/DnrJ/EryC1/StrS family aminotransferase [Firmicutes bacterium]|nr:DegT/DnrJ/EryC1/StrS family aminotransferase [Bacillota bacterium]
MGQPQSGSHARRSTERSQTLVNEAGADRHGLVVIEDSCESLGSEYKGIKAGNGAFSHGAVFAFYPNKQITTGEGGMIVTDDDRVARLCRSMSNQGRGEAGVWLSHERLGYNYRMDELSAALGVAQMSRIEEIIAKRERVAAMYAERLARVPGVRLPYVAPEVTRMSWFVYVIRVGVDEPTPERQSAARDHVMRRFQQPKRGGGSGFPATGLGDAIPHMFHLHPPSALLPGRV